MTVYLSVTSHLGGYDLVYSELVESDREQMLSIACDIMQDKLSDMKYLSEFTNMGKQAFYDDETGGDKSYATTGWSDHLCDHFVVVLDSGAKNFIVYNDKTVSSSRGQYNLFELLWYGFGPWSANRTPKFPSKEQFAYGERTKKSYKKFHAIGGPLVDVDVRINFYYRYAGKNFYNMTSRKGMSSGLVTKFHQYIDTAMSRSIEESLIKMEEE
jgi:hypothetical protein